MGLKNFSNLSPEHPSTIGSSQDDQRKALDRFLNLLCSHGDSRNEFLQSLPFSVDDITAGSENEYQAVVMGSKDSVDLALSLESSNFFKNIVKRSSSGLKPRKVATELEQFLNRAHHEVWENSWIRLPRNLLSHFANQVLSHDLLASKKNSTGPQRHDINKFVFENQGEEWLRIPISYLLRISLADCISSKPESHHVIRKVGEQLMNHYLNDNTSPETSSFHIMSLRPDSHMGRVVGREATKRFLFSQLLILYANQKFNLIKSGQRAMVYFAPHPPIRQKSLNELISDTLYRELFMNPCLSGWDSGEEKHRYMGLCHEVLSRSYFNAIAKLKDADIITRNLITLQSPSNISLANNGTHLSLGSRKLTALLKNDTTGHTAACEKYTGDLVIKIVEHFLPLFVGTYSAAPYRLDFWDFHPEKALGFLPHELESTYLRLLWQRWKRKAGLKIFGNPITPIGPIWLDKLVGKGFGLKGDFIPDFRLIDYLVVLPSTDQCPALDGTLGNDVLLKKDLAELGIYDERMSLYLLYKLRTFSGMGFSGFEGRYYSLFESLLDDFSDAASLQALITALAFKYIFEFEVTHAHIPDTPSVESERRQIFFGAALNVPTFYVHADTTNMFMRKILSKTNKIRMSRRFPQFIRVHHSEYRKALFTILQEDASELTEGFELRDCLDRLKDRIDQPSEYSTFGKLSKGIIEKAGVFSPLKINGNECNSIAEEYYRNDLRKHHIREGLECLEEDFKKLDELSCSTKENLPNIVKAILKNNRPATTFLNAIKHDIMEETADLTGIKKLIHLTLLSIHLDDSTHRTNIESCQYEIHQAPVHR